MAKFRIPVLLAGTFVACIVTWGCDEAFGRAGHQFPGRNPVALIVEGGHHIVYVDPETRRLMHRDGRGRITAITPEGDKVDLRGENTPLLAERRDGSLLVVYPLFLGGAHHKHIGELRAQASRDGGRTWSAPKRIDGDVAPRGHNFADLAARPNGDVVVSWLDSRAGKQGVQSAVLRPDLSVTPAETVDPLTCQCCRTALFAASNGDVWLAYRDLAENKVRNMAYAVSEPGRPFELRGDVADDAWAVNGCPESGPRFTEAARGTVWLAWFNGGAGAIETASATPGGRFVRRAAVRGRVNHPDIGTLPDGRLILVYEIFRDNKRAIELRTSDAAHSRWSEPAVLDVDGATPRYIRRGQNALLTYTKYIDDTPHVHVVDPLRAIKGESR
ncbi:MAG TPA: sialidase family protein [Thermoanaerobaculia bacterium]